MADNNDDQYLDELLNSLRSSNSDGNEDLDNQDSEGNKSRQSDAEDNESAEDGSNEEQDDFLNDIFSDSHNDKYHLNLFLSQKLIQLRRDSLLHLIKLLTPHRTDLCDTKIDRSGMEYLKVLI